MQWRRDFDVEALMSESFPATLASAGQLSGRDRTGCPITYNFYGGMDMDTILGVPGGLGK